MFLCNLLSPHSLTFLYLWVGELLIGFEDVVFLPSRASFYSSFRKITVEVKASGSPHFFKLCLGVCKGMLPV